MTDDAKKCIRNLQCHQRDLITPMKADQSDLRKRLEKYTLSAGNVEFKITFLKKVQIDLYKLNTRSPMFIARQVLQGVFQAFHHHHYFIMAEMISAIH